MKMPSAQTILDNKDNQEFLARVWRFANISEPEEIEAFNLVHEYFKGFNSELSKKIGWSE